MGYEVDYSNLTGQAKREKALADCKYYLGEDRYRKTMILIDQELQSGETTIEQMIAALALYLGIQGYPAQAMVESASAHPIEEVW